MILSVLVLQVVNNIALIMLAGETEGEASFEGWSAVLHLVDIICCCAVLIPIVWQVNALEAKLERGDDENKTEHEQLQPSMVASAEEAAHTLSKLKLFRSFYLAVVAYIYFTRIGFYLFATILDYKHIWVRYFVIELATLFFYVVTGIVFRPQSDDDYVAVNRKDDEETEIAIEGGDDEVEMRKLEPDGWKLRDKH
jgi:hypothetical protein